MAAIPFEAQASHSVRRWAHNGRNPARIRYAAAFEGKMHDVMHARAHTMTGLLSKVQSELEGTIRPLDKAIKEALDLGQDFEGLDEATHYAANPWLTLLGGAQVRSLIEAHHGLAHVAHPSLLKMRDLTDKMAESVPLRIGSVHRRGRFFVEEAVDSEGVAASHIYHTRVSYRDCCGVAGDASTTAGSVCGDASVKSTTSVNAPTAECGYMSSSSTASSAAIEPLRIRRVGRFLCDCFPRASPSDAT
ncbi:hypothetical protein FOZ60_004114 [Perkinsus olseni]|uniref:Uncharacterized protein n=1 Tax=Perkinsus olseni TaxID=32597 RepID=A0A7J6PI49_PEROL|nr:hypothetical protein FOZ60_004114 [Perkinsus olseni]